MRVQSVADAAAQADDLIRSGRLLDAVDALTELNRRLRAPELEVKLAALRRDAFAELEEAPSPSPRDVVPADPFPGHEGLPEVQGSQLTTALLEGVLHHHGVLMVRGLIDRGTAEALSDGVDRAFEGQARWRAGAPATETSPWFVPLENHPRYPLTDRAAWVRNQARLHRVLAADSPRVLFELFESLRAAGLDRILHEYFGGRPVLGENKFGLRRMPYREGGISSKWHQEAAVFDVEHRLRAVNLWLALSECGTDAPAIEFLPVRLSKVFNSGSRKSYGVPAELAHEATGHRAPASPDFAPGDGVLFDEMVFHRTRQHSGMTGLRRNVEAWFFSPWSHPGHNGRVVF